LAQGQLREAIGALTKATQLAPQQVDAYVGLARALWQQGDLLKAPAAVQTALRLAPDNSHVRALLHQWQGR
jgi:cytochrome c-type biogenesis protein CcmH/NrfG